MSDHDDDQPTVAPLGLRVVGGGEPTPEELAALVVALTPVAVPAAAVGDTGADRTPAWARAARLESVGHAPAVSADDLAGRTGAWS